MYFKLGTAGKIYNDATVWNAPIILKANESIRVVWEVDLTRPMIKKDLALTILAPTEGITITHLTNLGVPSGFTSDAGYPVF